jgi:cob(I)alamin adenosyltransferase
MIYTKTGDDGTTSLFGGKRISKSNLQVECYGTIDELNAFIGFAKISVRNRNIKELLTIIQKDLYTIMAFLSGSSKTSLLLIRKNTGLFETFIDTIEKRLPTITDFIIPQNNEPSTRLHLARTICRRVERLLIRYYENIGQNKKIPLYMKSSHAILTQYFNRLSDVLFIMARYESDGEELAKA